MIAEILILKNTQCYVNKTIAIFYIDSLFCTLQNCESRAQVSIQAQTIVGLLFIVFRLVEMRVVV